MHAGRRSLGTATASVAWTWLQEMPGGRGIRLGPGLRGAKVVHVSALHRVRCERRDVEGGGGSNAISAASRSSDTTRWTMPACDDHESSDEPS